MTTSNLDQVLEQVKSLSPDEQKQLRDILDRLLAKAGPQTTEEEFEQRLLERGFISHIPPPITDFTAYQNRRLIEVKGKPLSETIIEERR
jgi:hypothetical protein